MLQGKELGRIWRWSGFDVFSTNVLEGVRGIAEDLGHGFLQSRLGELPSSNHNRYLWSQRVPLFL